MIEKDWRQSPRIENWELSVYILYLNMFSQQQQQLEQVEKSEICLESNFGAKTKSINGIFSLICNI